MKVCKCKKCNYFQKANWSNGTIEQKIFGVSGFCIDDKNPDFNDFAKAYGRGISKTETILSPKWCRLREERSN
jgi:hypothetical protein